MQLRTFSRIPDKGPPVHIPAPICPQMVVMDEPIILCQVLWRDCSRSRHCKLTLQILSVKWLWLACPLPIQVGYGKHQGWKLPMVCVSPVCMSKWFETGSVPCVTAQ